MSSRFQVQSDYCDNFRKACFISGFQSDFRLLLHEISGSLETHQCSGFHTTSISGGAKANSNCFILEALEVAIPCALPALPLLNTIKDPALARYGSLTPPWRGSDRYANSPRFCSHPSLTTVAVETIPGGAAAIFPRVPALSLLNAPNNCCKRPVARSE